MREPNFLQHLVTEVDVTQLLINTQLLTIINKTRHVMHECMFSNRLIWQTSRLSFRGARTFLKEAMLQFFNFEAYVSILSWTAANAYCHMCSSWSWWIILPQWDSTKPRGSWLAFPSKQRMACWWRLMRVDFTSDSEKFQKKSHFSARTKTFGRRLFASMSHELGGTLTKTTLKRLILVKRKAETGTHEREVAAKVVRCFLLVLQPLAENSSMGCASLGIWCRENTHRGPRSIWIAKFRF